MAMGNRAAVNVTLKQFNVDKCRYDVSKTQQEWCRLTLFLL